MGTATLYYEGGRRRPRLTFTLLPYLLVAREKENLPQPLNTHNNNKKGKGRKIPLPLPPPPPTTTTTPPPPPPSSPAFFLILSRSTSFPSPRDTTQPSSGSPISMAAQQRTEKKKEDTDFKVPPESPSLSPLCSNNCGLSGSPSTNNMCQKCFNESSPSPSTTTSSPDRNPPRSVPSPSPPRRKPIHAPPTPTPLLRREVNRCSGCSRKVGLTGFRCRCGELFCADHRYSDRHDCSYDYKAAGREAISRENPVIKAAKIVRV